MRTHACLLSAVLVWSCGDALAADPPAAPPTVAEAREFLERVNAALLAASIESARTEWVGRTYITDDTEQLSAAADARAIAQRYQFIADSRRFDGLTLPPDLARQLLLLRRDAEPAPSDPALPGRSASDWAMLNSVAASGG